MTRLKNVVLTLAAAVNLCSCLVQDQRELILNPSFEEDSSNVPNWSLSERTDLWSVEKRPLSANSKPVHYSGTFSRSGHRSLSFEPWTKEQQASAFVSQYGSLDAGEYRSSPLVLVLWSHGDQSGNLKINLDVNYLDNRFLFVVANPVSSEDASGFAKTCVFVPNYGTIQSFMLTLVVDTTIERPIYIDDVSLRFTSHLSSQSGCLLYNRSYPVQRHILNDFLKPSSSEKLDYKITLAIQLTEDRLDVVGETAALWKGPISAALLLFGTPNAAELSRIVERYYSSESLSTYVTLHLVWEDPLNKKDSTMYPANALRNTAIAHCTTEHVFYIDADMYPSLSEAKTWKSLSKSIERAKQLAGSERCETCAFVAPLFNRASTKVPGYPKTKAQLEKRVADPSSDIEPCLLLSHQVVDYRRWFAASETYEIEYVEDMEPYFIVPSTAPLMNDAYTGYGRDKCAYSRDLNAVEFRFFVLEGLFVVNLLDPPESVNQIIKRAMDIPDRLFLNIEFHKNDLEHGHVRYPASYSSRSISYSSQTASGHSKYRPKYTASGDNDRQHRSSVNQDHTLVKDLNNSGSSSSDTKIAKDDGDSELETDGGTGCGTTSVGFKFPLIPDLVSLGMNVQPRRKDLIVESLMKLYGVHTYVEMPSASVAGSIRFMLMLMQPEAVVSVLPESNSEDREIRGIFENYRCKGTANEALKTVMADHPGPKLYSLNAEKLSDVKAKELSNAILQQASNDDVILIDTGSEMKPDEYWLQRFADMCSQRPDWRMYRKYDFVIMKSGALRKAPPETVPEAPGCLDSFRPRSGFGTDVILFSKNRPLQTFAFVDSLKTYATGLNKVWLLAKTEDAIFDDGYDLVVSCFSRFVSVEIIKESTTESFGRQILNIIRSSSAYSILIAVDEIIWIRPFDLGVVSSLLHDCPEAAMFQLRLGENIRVLERREYSDRFLSFRFDDDYLTYYPRRLPYDFGYVLNVDGVVARRLDLVREFEDFLPGCSTPGCVEQSWIVHRLHNASRRWHLMYRHSRMVNNMGMVDGRVADRYDSPAEGSYQLARVLVDERKRIDVEEFANENRHHTNTHQSKPVKFVPLEC